MKIVYKNGEGIMQQSHGSAFKDKLPYVYNG